MRDDLPIQRSLLEKHGPLGPLGPLGSRDTDALKAHGYGYPLRARFTDRDTSREIVFRTLAPDQFGHDRRADRFQQIVLALDTFGRFPGHVPTVDAGAIDQHGHLVSLPRGEPFLITAYAGGRLYARDLDALAERDHAPAQDLARARALAHYLTDVHAQRAPAEVYTRCVRDTIGSGEGIFGLSDSFSADDLIATPSRLESIEQAAIEWRWKLRTYTHRARRTHGDFHPFNILFHEGTALSVLDASRGSGECEREVVEARDPKHLYARSMRGAITNLPGAGAAYEVPLSAELTFDSGKTSPEAMADAITAAAGG